MRSSITEASHAIVGRPWARCVRSASRPAIRRNSSRETCARGIGCWRIDAAALDWFASVVHAHISALASSAHGLVATLAALADPRDWPEAWRRYHTHDHALHPIGVMREAIGAGFAIRDESRVPYLYRCLIPLLPEEPEAAALIEAVLADELRCAAEGRFPPVGWRLVAVR